MFTENVQSHHAIMGNKANFTCQVSGTHITLHWEILGRSGKYQDCTDPAFCVRSISETNFVNSTFEIDTTQLDATGITVHCVVQQNFWAQTIIRSSTGELTLQDVPPDGKMCSHVLTIMCNVHVHMHTLVMYNRAN